LNVRKRKTNYTPRRSNPLAIRSIVKKTVRKKLQAKPDGTVGQRAGRSTAFKN
jgi:hypothetical protein